MLFILKDFKICFSSIMDNLLLLHPETGLFSKDSHGSRWNEGRPSSTSQDLFIKCMHFILVLRVSGHEDIFVPYISLPSGQGPRE